MVNPPLWIQSLANSVSACLEPLEPMPPLGCHYHQSDSGWEITIFPAQTEIVGGAFDGRSMEPRFQVNLLEVTRLFSRLDELTWQTKSVDEEDQLGSHVACGGVFEGERVSVRILRRSPACFAPGRKAYINDGYLIDIW